MPVADREGEARRLAVRVDHLHPVRVGVLTPARPVAERLGVRVDPVERRQILDAEDQRVLAPRVGLESESVRLTLQRGCIKNGSSESDLGRCEETKHMYM